MANHWGAFSAWISLTANESELRRYLAESYDAERVLSPISRFAEDFGIEWYDHDFIEYDYLDSRDSFPTQIEPLASALSNKGIDTVRGLILLYDFSYTGNIKETSSAIFLGEFAYRRI